MDYRTQTNDLLSDVNLHSERLNNLDVNNFIQRVITIEHEIHKLHVKIDLILELLTDTRKSCTKMDDHIEFINNTYKSLKAPLDYISDSFNNTKNLLGNS